MDQKTKDGKLVSCTVSTAIQNQLPRHILTEYPNFVEFLEHYYKWLELEDNAVYANVLLQDTLDVDRTVDEYLEWFKKTYLHNIPIDAFGVNREETQTFTVGEDFSSALTYTCLCESPSQRFYINPAATGTVDFFPIDFLRAANWVVSVRNEVSGEAEAFRMIATHDGTNTYDNIFAQLGPALSYDVDTSIVGSTFKLDITNNEANRLIVDIVRAPTFTESNEIGPQRCFLVEREINDQTEVFVTVNGIELDSSQFTVGPRLSFCDNQSREVCLDDSVIVAVGDTVVVNVKEVRELDQRLLIKNIQRLLKEKGTEESFRLLFRLLFNEEIDVSYPGERILRASDGKWQGNRKSIRVTTNGTIENMLYRNIEVVQAINGEDVVVGKFTVEEIQTQTIENYEVADLFITDITGTLPLSNNLVKVDGTYVPEYRIRVSYTDLDGNSVSEVETLYPILTNVEITDGGTGYTKGKRVPASETFTLKKRFVSDGVTTAIDTGLSVTLLSSETRVVLDPDGAGTILTEGVDYNISGSVVTFLSPVPDSTEVEVQLISKGAYVTVKETDGAGAVQALEIYDPGVGYTTESTLDFSGIGNGDAVGDVNSGALDGIILKYDGRYLNTDGHLSSTHVIQDGYKNQGFAYIIKSTRTIDQYGDILKGLLHPAGFLAFGEIRLIRCVRNFIRSAQYLYTFPPVQTSSSNNPVGAPKLGPRYRSFDENKLRYRIWDGIEPNTQVQAIYDELVGSFINTPDEKLHFLLDSEIGITATFTFEGVVGANAVINVPYFTDANDIFTVTGSVSGSITPTGFIFPDPEDDPVFTTIQLDADAGGETITVNIALNTSV